MLILKDGRLGLLDYGMVGRVTQGQRKKMAKTVIALANKDRQAVNDIYKESGYRASWREGSLDDFPEILYRFAVTHFDKFDLSPVVLPPKQSMWSSATAATGGNSTAEVSKKGSFHLPHGNHRTIKYLDVIQTAAEWAVPDWIEQGRRLTALLAGVSLQAGRPLSMAKEWYSLAEEVLEEVDEDSPEELK